MSAESDLLTVMWQVPRAQRSGMCSESSSEGDVKFSNGTNKYLLADGDNVDVIQLTGADLASQVNIMPNSGTAGNKNNTELIVLTFSTKLKITIRLID